MSTLNHRGYLRTKINCRLIACYYATTTMPDMQGMDRGVHTRTRRLGSERGIEESQASGYLF